VNVIATNAAAPSIAAMAVEVGFVNGCTLDFNLSVAGESKLRLIQEVLAHSSLM
jgi:hypothetical protein